MATFVLVHGGFHGPWCWTELVPLLEKRGHRVVTPELPVDDPAASLEVYAGTVHDALAGHDPTDVVLVGHSLGCRVVPLVAASVEVAALVLLCHVPTRAGGEAPDTASMAGLLSTRVFADSSGLLLLEPSELRRVFYGSCRPETADWALARLRPQAVAPLLEPWELTAWPTVPTFVVLGSDDVVTPLEQARRDASTELPDQPEPVVLACDHSPFLSAPEELAEVLERASTT